MKTYKKIIISMLIILSLFTIISGVSASDLNNDTSTISETNHKEVSISDSQDLNDKSTIMTHHNVDNDKTNNDNTKSEINDGKLSDTNTIFVAPNENPEYGEGSESKPFASINKAVNSSKTGSNRIIIKEGTYKENNILIDGDKEISIIGEGHVVIDGGSLEKNSIFTIKTKDVIIKNIIFANNNARHGSALFIEGSSNDSLEINLNIDNCSFDNLEATRGGAIYVHYTYGNLIITNSSFTKSNATWGAICVHTCGEEGGLNLKINNSRFSDNFANNAGALYLMQTGEIIIGNSSFYNNSAANDPGLIYLSSCNAEFDNCLIYNNTASQNKPIISVTGKKVQVETDVYTMVPSNIVFTNCVIENNIVDAVTVPVIQLKNSNLDISYSSIENSGLVIENTVIPNYNDDKPGIVIANNNWWGINDPLAKVNGSNIVLDKWLILNIVSNSTNVTPGDEVKFSIDFNHVQTINGGIEELSGGVIPKESYNVWLSAKKGVLSSESTEIKNGEIKDVIYTANEIPDTLTVISGDYVLKTVISDGSEPYYGIIYVSMDGNDNNDGSYDAPVANISKAIELASIDGGSGQIIIREGTYVGCGYQINSDLSIIGQGNVVVDAEGKGRLFYMPYGVEVDEFSLSNLTLTGSNDDIVYSFAKKLILNHIIIINNPNAGDLITSYGNLTINNSKISGHNGGDIICSSVSSLKTADIIINNTLFENNIVNASSSDYGIIYTSGRGNLIVENSQFINNTLRHSVIVGSDNVKINVKNSIFHDNMATIGYGGAIRVSSILIVENSSFINNCAKKDGGAIHVSLNANAKIIKSEFINNSAGNSKHGNAIYNNGELSVNYCVLLNNITSDYLIYNENTKPVNAQYNWWGSNDNPKKLVSRQKDADDDEEDDGKSAEVDVSNWVIMNLNVPDTVYNGFKVKPSVDFNHYMNGSEIKELEETIPGVNVLVSAINGSLDTNSLISIDGVASVIYTAKDCGEDIISFTSCNVTLSKKIIIRDKNQDSIAIVTPETIVGFFDDNGVLNDIDFKELIFTGKFNDLNLTINKNDIILTGLDALFNNVGLIINADNVKVSNITFIADKVLDDICSAIIYADCENIIIENNNITYNAPNNVDSYAIFFDGADGCQLINNKINYMGHLANDTKTIAVYSINSDNLIIKDNEIFAVIPSVHVEYIPPDYLGKIIYSAGLLLDDGGNLNLENNNITVYYDGDDGNYDTIYAVKVIKGDTAKISENRIEANGHQYTYGLSVDGANMNIKQNNISSDSDDKYANGLEIAGDSSAMIEGNNINTNANDVTYSVYAENSGQLGSELTINNNNISAESNTAYGMIIVTSKNATISNNDISTRANYTKGLGFKNGKALISKNKISANGSNIGTSTDSSPITPIETIGLYTLNANIDVKNNTITSTGLYTVNAVKSNGTIKDNDLTTTNDTKGDASIKQTDSKIIIDNKESNPNTPPNPSTSTKTPNTTPTTSTPTEKTNTKPKATTTPKQIIAAKNLKVKKSTKTLKIKVSLKKVNNKLLKNKKVILKFRNKKYITKTNKKGVAVFKISKKVLHKLKVGKTYKYTVSYGKYKLTKKISLKK